MFLVVLFLCVCVCTVLHDYVLISVFVSAVYVACAPDFYICVCIAPVIEEVDPCNPSPCGPYSQCRNVNAQGVCSCLPTYIGSPPGCRPECVASSECPQNRACINLKCVDPCPGPCGLNTRCETVNHSPICSCHQGFTGDPFTQCYAVPRKHYLIHFLFLPKIQWSLYHSYAFSLIHVI